MKFKYVTTKRLSENQRSLVFLLLSIGLITLPHINHVSLPIFIGFSILLCWRLLAIWKTQYLPGKLICLFLTICGLALLYNQQQSILGLDAGTSIFVLALGLKLMEIREQKDIYFIVFLAFIVASTQFLYQQSILMAVYILLVCCLLLATLVTINSQNITPWKAVKKSLMIVIQALPISIIVFVFFPRIEPPKWMLFYQPNNATSGLSDSLEPGSISRLGLSDELVFRVKFAGQLPPFNQRYWRGPVFSKTDGKRWTQTSVRNLPLNQKVHFSGSRYQYTLMMEPQVEKWVFALDMASSIPQQLKQNALYQLIDIESQGKRAEYNIHSYTHYNTGVISGYDLKENVQLPSGPSEKINQLVEQLHGFDASAEIFIQALLNHFRNENFYYTLKPPLMGEQPIDTFLFNSRYGFCSHYATAFVYLMRVAGIPARVVAGYQGGELNKVGGFLEIKQANAHAWVEVWLENKGWTRFDPTAAIAPERIEQDVNIDLQISTGLVNFTRFNVESGKLFLWMKNARQAWSSIDYSWQRWVINYNGDSQFTFLSSLGLGSIKAQTYWFIGIITLLTFLIAWFLLKTKKVRVEKELQIYHVFCKKLAKAGFNKNRGESALSFSLRVQQQHPDLAQKIAKIIYLFNKIRYGDHEVENEYIELKKAVKDFKLKKD